MAEKINDELSVVEAFSRSDEFTFEGIVELYTADVAAFANRLLGWPGDVDDITQEVFLAAYLGLKKFRHNCSIKTWLFTITINKCRSFRYKKQLKLHNSQASGSPGQSSAADAKLIKSETFEQIRNAVRALPAKYREAVVLRYLQELEMDQISTILKISKDAVNVRLSRAREYLKDDLKELMET
jgi:RNA polymerase sigma-70 factor, ECF subfamily